MEKIEVSILIATFNSQNILGRVLESIKKQTLPRNRFEILIIDGGSKDDTLEIAKKYKCKIIRNPLIVPLNAKYLGFFKARGRYVMTLDHDEVLQNKKSLENRINIFKRDKRVKILYGSGYITPENSSPINHYLNEYGDPFSFFIYRLTKDYRYFIGTMRKRYEVVYDGDNYIIVKVLLGERPPLMEVMTGGGMVDKAYVLKKFSKYVSVKENFLPFMNLHFLKISPYIAIMKNDPLYHYTTENLKKYLKKLEWRIRNNVYFHNTTDTADFLNREDYEGKGKDVKKYLFIPYGLTLFFPLLDSLWLSITRRNLIYLIHLPLAILTAILIIYHYLKKILGFRPVPTSYDGTTKIVKRYN